MAKKEIFVYEYIVTFTGDDIVTNVTVTEETIEPDTLHDEIVEFAQDTLCKMWGVEKIPDNLFHIVDVEVFEVQL